jgi:hypothetical protein
MEGSKNASKNEAIEPVVMEDPLAPSGIYVPPVMPQGRVQHLDVRDYTATCPDYSVTLEQRAKLEGRDIWASSQHSV